QNRINLSEFQGAQIDSLIILTSQSSAGLTGPIGSHYRSRVLDGFGIVCCVWLPFRNACRYTLIKHQRLRIVKYESAVALPLKGFILNAIVSDELISVGIIKSSAAKR